MLSVWWIIGLASPGLLVDPILPDGCPSVREITAQVTAFAPDVADQPGRMRIGITAVDGRLEAQLSVERPGQPITTRVVSGSATDCSALVSAVALTAALVLEPAQAPPPPVPATPPPVAPPSEPAAPVSVAAAPASTPAAVSDAVTPSAGPGWRAHAAILGSTGALPGVGATVEIGAGLRGDHWRADLGARAHLALPADVSSGTVAGQLWAGTGAGCRLFDALAVCGVVVAGYQTLDGADFETNRNVSGVYLASGLRAEYAWRLLDDWSVAAVGEVLAPLTRVKLTVDDALVWETPATLGALGAAISRAF